MKKQGIIDHSLKLEVIAAILRVECSSTSIAEMLVTTHKSSTPKERMSDNIRKYTQVNGSAESNPSGNVGREYLRLVGLELERNGWAQSNIQAFYRNSSFHDFAISTPRKLLVGNTKLSRLVSPVLESTLVPATYSYKSKDSLDIEKMFFREHIDQLVIYESEKAAKAWKEVTASREYRQYDHCLEALGDVFASEEWAVFVSTKQPDGFVSLGAGSASKDFFIFDKFKEKSSVNSAVKISLVDYSQSMLDDTCSELLTYLSRSRYRHGSDFEIKMVRTNFLELEPIECLRRKGVPIAFIIPGGTIGNINEAEFLNSIRRVSEAGDFLIICAETLPNSPVDGSERENFKKELLKKYNTHQAKDLLTPALEKIWYLLNLNKSFSEAKYDCIVPSIIEGRQQGVTTVPNSLSVSFSVKADQKFIKLIASTRYEEKSFIEFVEESIGSLIFTGQSRENPLFKSFVFEVR